MTLILLYYWRTLPFICGQLLNVVIHTIGKNCLHENCFDMRLTSIMPNVSHVLMGYRVRDIFPFVFYLVHTSNGYLHTSSEERHYRSLLCFDRKNIKLSHSEDEKLLNSKQVIGCDLLCNWIAFQASLQKMVQ